MRKFKSNRSLNELIKLNRAFREPDVQIKDEFKIDEADEVEIKNSKQDDLLQSIEGLKTKEKVSLIADLFRMFVPNIEKIKNVLFDIGLEYDEEEDWENSIFYYQLSNLLEPNPKCFNNLAVIYSILEKPSCAVTKLKEGLAFFPEDQNLCENLDILLEEN